MESILVNQLHSAYVERIINWPIWFWHHRPRGQPPISVGKCVHTSYGPEDNSSIECRSRHIQSSVCVSNASHPNVGQAETHWNNICFKGAYNYMSCTVIQIDRLANIVLKMYWSMLSINLSINIRLSIDINCRPSRLKNRLSQRSCSGRIIGRVQRGPASRQVLQGSSELSPWSRHQVWKPRKCWWVGQEESQRCHWESFCHRSYLFWFMRIYHYHQIFWSTRDNLIGWL